jgi:outer membrane protein assembly factor BamB
VLARATGGSHGEEAGQTAARAGRAGAMLSVPGRAATPRAEQPSAPLGYWPRFHGPHADNISSDVGLLKSWPPQGPRLLWTALGIGEGYSSVTLAKGLIYTAGNVGDATTVTALDGNGRIVWQVEAGKAWTESYPGTRSTPTIDGDRLYFESPLGDLVCLDCLTGKRLWGQNILDQFAAHNIIWALAESPLVDGDRVICCPCGQKASVAALDKNSGRTIWAAASTNEPAGYASPVLVEHQGLRIILAMTGRSLLGVSAADGAILWQFAHATQYDINALTPICHDGRIFISSGYRVGSELLKINAEGGKFSVAKLWQCPTLDNQHGGVLLLGGRFYGASHASSSGKWICVDGKTGAVLSAAAGLGPATFTCAERLLYAMNEHGKVGLVAPTPKGLQVLSEFQLPHRGEGPTWALYPLRNVCHKMRFK